MLMHAVGSDRGPLFYSLPCHTHCQSLYMAGFAILLCLPCRLSCHTCGAAPGGGYSYLACSAAVQLSPRVDTVRERDVCDSRLAALRHPGDVCAPCGESHALLKAPASLAAPFNQEDLPAATVWG